MVEAELTQHFIIQYDELETPNGKLLATALTQFCEKDYAYLSSVFRAEPPSFIRVTVDNGVGGRQNRRDIVHAGDNNRTASGDSDYLRAAFVMELSELFMYAQNGGWDPSDSKGEALSRIFGHIIVPGGMQPSFTVHQWIDDDPDPLDSSAKRLLGLEDWVRFVDSSDTRAKSIGCGVAFIDFMMHPLGHSIEDIVAQNARTLEGIWRSLRGLPPIGDADFDHQDNPFITMAKLVRTRFPQGAPSNLNSSNKFPDSDLIFA